MSLHIVFVCGRIEPGRDGVGDYTRRLAGELIRKGHKAAIIGLFDSFVTTIKNEQQDEGGFAIEVLRIPYSAGESRYAIAGEWIEKYNPEWISLQYVPFMFHPKGLSINAGNRLKSIANGRKWHVMIHELWLGMANEESKKLKLWGFLQKLLINRFFKSLSPKIIHTQNHLYQLQMQKLGFKADYLPLFSNLIVNDKPPSCNASNGIQLVLFGVIHKNAPVGLLVQEIAHYCKTHNTKVCLTLIGRNGNEQGRWLQAWKAAGLGVEVMGEQPVSVVSDLLHCANAGISTTAYALIEKSSSFATMRGHGLPVLCVSVPWTPSGIGELPPVESTVNYTGGNFKDILAQKKTNFAVDLASITEQLIYSLKD